MPWEQEALRESERMNGELCGMVGYGMQALRGAIIDLKAGAADFALKELERDLAEMERRWEARREEGAR